MNLSKDSKMRYPKNSGARPPDMIKYPYSLLLDLISISKTDPSKSAQQMKGTSPSRGCRLRRTASKCHDGVVVTLINHSKGEIHEHYYRRHRSCQERVCCSRRGRERQGRVGQTQVLCLAGKKPTPKHTERSRSAYGGVCINDWLCGAAHNALRFLAASVAWVKPKA